MTLDGLGGVGKTTTVDHLRRHLAERGYAVHTTTEPSHATLGEIARHHTNIYSGHTLACLVTADRYHHLATEIRPQLAAGKVVICDRYVPSSYVFQRMDGVPLEFIDAINADADRPDLAVILIAAPEIAAGRVAERGAHSRFEAGIETSRHELVLYHHATQRLAARHYPLVIIDTSRMSPEQIAISIGQKIAALAGLHDSRGTTA